MINSKLFLMFSVLKDATVQVVELEEGGWCETRRIVQKTI